MGSVQPMWHSGYILYIVLFYVSIFSLFPVVKIFSFYVLNLFVLIMSSNFLFGDWYFF